MKVVIGFVAVVILFVGITIYRRIKRNKTRQAKEQKLVSPPRPPRQYLSEKASKALDLAMDAEDDRFRGSKMWD
jgi:hypothetical protein